MSKPESQTARWHSVSGPYYYAGHTHPSFNVNAPDGPIASVYMLDGDEEAARRRALVCACALDALMEINNG
jgi:hypothetical protein